MSRIWKHKWVHPHIEVRQSSIHGDGSFAAKLIKKGEVVSVNGGLVVPIEEAHIIRKEMGSLRGLQVHDGFLLSVVDPSEAMFNHSCEPNIGLSGQVVSVAIRDINPGEEILYSYFFSESNIEEFACTCGSATCRTKVTSTGWKDDPQFIEKYFEYYSPYLQSKIRSAK